MFSLLNALRHKYRRGNRQTEGDERVADLDPDQRQSVMDEILSLNREQDAELKELDEQLNVARAQLQKAEEREKFVGMRVETYRGMLEKQAHLLEPKTDKESIIVEEREPLTTTAACSSTDAESSAAVKDEEHETRSPSEERTPLPPQDEETGQSVLLEEERQRQLAKLKQQEVALDQADVAHRKLAVQVRELKKSILVLQYKRNQVAGMQQEQTDFLVAAAAAQDHEQLYILPENEDQEEEPQQVAGVVETDPQDGGEDRAGVVGDLSHLRISGHDQKVGDGGPSTDEQTHQNEIPSE